MSSKLLVESNRAMFSARGGGAGATYGHSHRGETPKYTAYNENQKLYHMTTKRAIPSIMKNGLRQQTRQYIHLTTEYCAKSKGRTEALTVEPEILRQNKI